MVTQALALVKAHPAAQSSVRKPGLGTGLESEAHTEHTENHELLANLIGLAKQLESFA